MLEQFDVSWVLKHENLIQLWGYISFQGQGKRRVTLLVYLIVVNPLLKKQADELIGLTLHSIMERVALRVINSKTVYTSGFKCIEDPDDYSFLATRAS